MHVDKSMLHNVIYQVVVTTFHLFNWWTYDTFLCVKIVTVGVQVAFITQLPLTTCILLLNMFQKGRLLVQIQDFKTTL